MFIFLNLFQTFVDLYSCIKNIFDDFYLLNIVQKIIRLFVLILFFILFACVAVFAASILNVFKKQAFIIVIHVLM